MIKVITSIAVLCTCVVIILVIGNIGRAKRVYGASFKLSQDRIPVYLVRNTSDVPLLWKEKHLHGRIVVNLSKFLHFLPPDTPERYRVSGSYPLKVEKVSDLTGRQVTYQSFLWAAMQDNVAREIYHVTPRRDFLKRFQLKDPAEAEKDVIFQATGSRRTVTTRLPSVAEPVVVNIDASFLDSTSVANAVTMLRNSGLSADMVSVCMAEDSPDVSDHERVLAREFAGRLSAGGGITGYGSSIVTSTGDAR